MYKRLRKPAIGLSIGAMALSLSLFTVAPASATEGSVPTEQTEEQENEAYGSYELFLVEDPDDPHYLIEMEGTEAAQDGSTVNIYSENGEAVEALPAEIETPGGETVSVTYEVADNGESIKIYPDVEDLMGLSSGGGMQAMSNNCERNTSLLAIGRGAVTGGFAGAPGGPAGVTVGAVAGATGGALEGGLVSIFLC